MFFSHNKQAGFLFCFVVNCFFAPHKRSHSIIKLHIFFNLCKFVQPYIYIYIFFACGLSKNVDIREKLRYKGIFCRLFTAPCINGRYCVEIKNWGEFRNVLKFKNFNFSYPSFSRFTYPSWLSTNTNTQPLGDFFVEIIISIFSQLLKHHGDVQVKR